MIRFKTLLTLPAFFLIASGLHAQDTTMVYPRNQIKANPLKAIGMINPGIELTYERKVARHFSTQVSAAVLENLLHTANYQSFNGYRLSVEQKYLVPIKELGLWCYPSVSVVRNVMDITDVAYFEDSNTVTRPPMGHYKYLDTFSLHKETFSVNANFGVIIPMGHFVMDICGGVGVKHRNTVHADRINPADILESTHHPNAYNIAEREGVMNVANLVFSIRIGYSF